MKRILLIEDEVHIADGIKLNLEFSGYECFWTDLGRKGVIMFDELKPDLVILDLMLPDMDGMDVLKGIRNKDSSLPVLILSARGEVEDRKLGLSMGCDDYMAKPFDLEELELRVQRLLFRAEKFRKIRDSISFGNNTIDFDMRSAKSMDKKISLTEQEVLLLKYLNENRKKPVTREDMLIHALGYEEDVQSRTIDNFMVRFRKYFERNPKKPKYFKSIRSVGYMFDPDNDQA